MFERLRYRRAQDRIERAMRKRSRGGQCPVCALSGVTRKATHGWYCKPHFDEVAFPKAMDLL